MIEFTDEMVLAVMEEITVLAAREKAGLCGECGAAPGVKRTCKVSDTDTTECNCCEQCKCDPQILKELAELPGGPGEKS